MKNPLNFVQPAAPKFVRFSEKIGEIKFRGLFLRVCIQGQFLTKNLRIFSRNFDRNTFSKNLRNFQKSQNLVKIPRIFQRIWLIGLGLGLPFGSIWCKVCPTVVPFAQLFGSLFWQRSWASVNGKFSLSSLPQLSQKL